MREDNDVYVYNYRRHPDLDNPGVWHDHAFAENQPWYRHYYPQSFEMQPPPRPGRSLARVRMDCACQMRYYIILTTVPLKFPDITCYICSQLFTTVVLMSCWLSIGRFATPSSKPSLGSTSTGSCTVIPS